MTETETALSKLDVAKRVLAEARDLTEVLKIREIAIAVQAVASSRRAEEAAALAMEVKLRAERKAGEFLSEKIPHEGGRPRNSDNMSPLSKAGVKKKESERWQKMAAIPEKRFEQILADTRTRTQKAVLQVAKDLSLELNQQDPPLVSLPENGFIPTIVSGRFQDAQLEDESIDLVLTDPPYGSEWLSQWDDLGRIASRVLKPGGWLVTYSGHPYLPEILASLSKHLTYYWMMAIENTGAQARVKMVSVGWKPVLLYHKPPCKMDKRFNDFYSLEGTIDKTLHPWQQNYNLFEYLVRTFSHPGETVFEPLAGAGTTIAAAIKNNRQCYAVEQDPKMVSVLKKRFGLE